LKRQSGFITFVAAIIREETARPKRNRAVRYILKFPLDRDDVHTQAMRNSCVKIITSK
jgi:hypothetical protein